MARRTHMNKIADFFDWATGRAKLTDEELADELGTMKPSMITMMRCGQVKLPLEQIPTIARALNVDPAFMLRKALAEYMPEVFEVMIETFGKPLSEYLLTWLAERCCVRLADVSQHMGDQGAEISTERCREGCASR